MSPTCRLGGPAPCFDDLCHSGGETLCGLDLDFEREILGEDDEMDDAEYDELLAEGEAIARRFEVEP